MRFLRAIESALALDGGRLAVERGVKAVLDQTLAHAPNGRKADIQRVGDRIVRPGRAGGALVSFEEDAGVGQRAGRRGARSDEVVEVGAFVVSERDTVLLIHGRTP